MRVIPTSKDDVFAFEMNGTITAEQTADLVEEVNAVFERHEKVRLLNRIKHFGGFQPAVFMQSGLFSMKLATMHKVERYAIVGAPGWIAKAVESVNPLFHDIDMRTFPADREDEAWAWVDAKAAE